MCRDIVTFSSDGKSLIHSFQIAFSFVAISVSQPMPCLHKFCSSTLALIITGAANPNGWNNKLTTDIIPIFVKGFNGMLTFILIMIFKGSKRAKFSQTCREIIVFTS